MSIENIQMTNENTNKNLESNQQKNQNENLELSKNSTDIENINSSNQQGNESEESNLLLFYEEDSNENEKMTKDEQKTFENNFNKYYVDSSKNTNGNFDTYIENGLKLISCLPDEKTYSSQIEKIKEKINIPPLKPNEEDKKTLILDLDETLIHSDLDFIYDSHDVTLSFKDCEEDSHEMIPIPLILRPYLKEFLDFVSEYFELVVFTASYKSYAEPILDYLEKDKKYFKIRLFREHCIRIHNCLYIKDLSIFEGKRKMENIVIVDNSIFSFAKQLNNGILVTSFYNDINDSFLSNLCYYLKEYILPSKDVRKVNESSFGFVELSKKLSIV